MKYCIKTYGCQMNKSDSERIASLLESAGLERTYEESDADLIVMNVCSIRQTAIDRIFGNMKKYNKIKKCNPNFKTVITGCVLPKDKTKFENMFDLVIDIKEINKIFDRLGIPIENDRLSNIESYFNIDPKHQSKITAYMPIMTGCDNFCSYCVVPFTRGREYSRPAEEIINEVSNLIKKGYKEIILLGQNVNSYKSQISKSKFQTNYKLQITNYDSIYFPALLKLINAIPGNFWIRFLTSHPKDMTEELIKAISECKKCAEYMHLALQSGDDEILKNMNRKYTAKHFLKLTELIRKYMPDAAITTDVIVGYPGETEEQFRHTADVMKKAKFDMVYINKYSPREGTASAKLPNNVSLNEKKVREKFLTDILKETALENNKKYIGKTIDVLAEKVDDEFIYGKTGTFKNVKVSVGSIIPSEPWSRNAECNKSQDANAKGFHGAKATMEPAKETANHIRNSQFIISNSNLIGKFVKIKITRASAWGLEGEVT